MLLKSTMVSLHQWGLVSIRKDRGLLTELIGTEQDPFLTRLRSILKNEKDGYRNSITDLSLEGVLHSKQKKCQASLYPELKLTPVLELINNDLYIRFWYTRKQAIYGFYN